MINLPNYINIPLDDLVKNLHKLEEENVLSRDKNIFIMCTNNEKSDGRYGMDYVQTFDQSVCYLVNNQGEILSNGLRFPMSLYNPSDDMVTLEDGSVVWCFIDDNNDLYFCPFFAYACANNA